MEFDYDMRVCNEITKSKKIVGPPFYPELAFKAAYFL